HHNPLLGHQQQHEGQQLSQYMRQTSDSMQPSNPSSSSATYMTTHLHNQEGLQQQTQFDFVTSAGHAELMPEPPPYDQFNIEWPNIQIPIPADPPEFILGGGQQQLFEPEEQNFLLDKFIQFFDVDPGNQNFMLTPEIQFYPPSNDTTNNHLIADGSTSVSAVVDANSSPSSHIYGGNGITNTNESSTNVVTKIDKLSRFR
ncbi:12982_t:CDS:2, partial [Ambispora gerdemannii]